MKIIVGLIGISFAYWNVRGLEENPLALWHYIVLTATAGCLGAMLFVRLFETLAAPPCRRTGKRSGGQFCQYCGR